MKDVREIQAVLDQLQPLVNEGNPRAECIWDALRWVTGQEDESPFDTWLKVS